MSRGLRIWMTPPDGALAATVSQLLSGSDAGTICAPQHATARGRYRSAACVGRA